jgi:NeuB family
MIRNVRLESLTYPITSAVPLSAYPSKVEELNPGVIRTLKERYKVPVGYSGHEVGLSTRVAAVVLGACMVERHITLDRAVWGSDQAASVESQGFSPGWSATSAPRSRPWAMASSGFTTARFPSARSCAGSSGPEVARRL